MLTQALSALIEANGGAVHLSSAVEEILVEGRKATGVRIGTEIHTARAVVAGTHVLETFGRLLPEAYRPEAAQRVRVGNGFGAILRLALDRPIRYAAHPGDEARIALQLICNDRKTIDRAYGEYLSGRPTQDPPIVAMSFSAVDDTLAPAGGEVLWLWAQYFPYDLAKGSWDEIGDQVAENILSTFDRYAPGTSASVVGSLFQHPLWLEREIGLYRGNVMHLEMSFDQMFLFRPFMEASRYRTPLKGLYLTGASTHPGGGIMGASGRNAARVLLKDLSRHRV